MSDLALDVLMSKALLQGVPGFERKRTFTLHSASGGCEKVTDNRTIDPGIKRFFESPRAYVWVKKYSLCTGTPDFRANERDIRPNKSTC